VINGRKWWISGAGDPRCKIAIVMGKTGRKQRENHKREKKRNGEGLLTASVVSFSSQLIVVYVVFFFLRSNRADSQAAVDGSCSVREFCFEGVSTE
jgi:hypothetical protein